MKKLISLMVLSLIMMTGLAWAQGTITFDEVDDGNVNVWGLSGTFGAKSLTINNVTWQYADARDEGSYAIDGAGIMLRKASESFLQAIIPNGVGSFSFQYRKAYTGRDVRQLEFYVNDVSVATTPEFGAGSGAQETVYIFLNELQIEGEVTIKIKNVGNTVASRHAVLDNIKWTAYNQSFSDPTLHISPLNLSEFCYIEDEGPSTAQNFIVQGWHFDEEAVITTDDDSAFEISLNEKGIFTNNLSITPIDEQIETTPIYVRLKAGLEPGGYTGSITVSTFKDEIQDETVYLEGMVNDYVSPHCYYVTFENEDETKSGYDSGEVELSGIEWNMTEALIGGSDLGDFKFGLKSARLSGKANSSMTMLDDKENGFGKLSFFYRAYGTDTQVDWKVEYSTDQGSNWTQVGSVFTAPKSDEVQVFSEIVNVPGDVRIRIKRATESGDQNRRLNIDNILMTSCLGYDYNTGIEEDTNIGIITFTKGYANNSDSTMPAMPNTGIGADEYKSLALELVESTSWTIEIVPTEGEYIYCAYNWQGIWYNAEPSNGGFEIEIESDAKGPNDLFIVLSAQNPTLPVELSSFTVALNPRGNPVVTWVTQTETGVNGFYIYRGESKNFDDAIMISNLIPVTNSSLEHSYSFEDTELYATGVYYYWLNVSDLNGHESYHGPIKLSYNLENSGAPDMVYQTGFKSIYPNPFNPNANISFELAEDSEVLISVYNTRGQIVRSFAPFSHNAGYGSIVWDGKDDGGTYLASGIYLFRMAVGAENYNRKALMLK